MDTLLATLLNIPILQAFGLILLIGAAERAGIPIIDFTKKVLNLKEDTVVREVNVDNRNALQVLLQQMEQLTQYANHDTTALLTEIRDNLKDNFTAIKNKHREWDTYGINTRECAKKT